MWEICTFNPLWGTGAGEQNANEETHEGGGGDMNIMGALI